MDLNINKPTPILEEHNTNVFCSGNDLLDDWLKFKALSNEKKRASRCFVITKNNTIIGYYAIAAGSIAHKEATGKIRRNMPDPIPIMILGRLAIDKNYQHMGLGTALLKDVLLRSLQAADIIGIKAILVHAIDQNAIHFYQERGFRSSPIDEKILMLSLEEIIQNI